MITSATSALTIQGTPTAGNFVQVRVNRNPTSGSDTLPQTAQLLCVKIGYTRA